MPFDPEKNKKNLRDHGIDLSFGDQVLSDSNALEVLDNTMDYGEERWNMLGMVKGIIYHLTYTDTEEGFRYISLRKAEKSEEIRYYKREINHGND
ncbi:MAG: BrnT family toxin [Rhodospirillaceae bacterium]